MWVPHERSGTPDGGCNVAASLHRHEGSWRRLMKVTLVSSHRQRQHTEGPLVGSVSEHVVATLHAMSDSWAGRVVLVRLRLIHSIA